MKRNFTLTILATLILMFAGLSANAEGFPTAGEYEIHSLPTFLVTVGDSQEVVECEATLTVRASDPYITQNGSKRVDLEVIDWNASGKSVLMGGPLHFSMRHDVKAEGKSFVQSYQVAGSADFPAQAQFAVPYQIETPFGTVDGLFGVTKGTIKAFPPDGDIFMMEKGDVGKVMAELMPAAVTEMSAAGDSDDVKVDIQALACACPVASLDSGS
jgi:hypothetical protein